MTNFQNSTSVSASSPGAQNLKFEREDWVLFRTIEGLQQKAGVPKDGLARLVLKELADNGLDAGAKVKVGALAKRGYYVEDDGPGIDGTPEEIARLFSIRRPGVVEAAAAADQRSARQRPPRGRRYGAGLRWLGERHHPQSPHRAAPRARRQHDGRER